MGYMMNMNKEQLKGMAIARIMIAEQYKNLFSAEEIRKAYVIRTLTADNSHITMADIKNAIAEANKIIGGK